MLAGRLAPNVYHHENAARAGSSRALRVFQPNQQPPTTGMQNSNMPTTSESSNNDIWGTDADMASDTRDDDADVEEDDVTMNSEVEVLSSDEETEPEDKTVETISQLENLALSFISQLTAALQPKPGRDSGYSSNSQPEAPPKPKRIVLELTKRGKPQKPDDDAKMRSVRFPRKSKGPSARAPAQLLKVANEAHEALMNQSPMTKRDLFYKDVSLFKSQATVDALVDDLAATFSINRSDLNIRASSKGLYCGSAITIHLHDGTVLVGHDTEASLIPNGQDIVEFEISEEVAWILVIEKDAVFQTLKAAGLTNHPDLPGPGILITGKGYPDVATRQLVKTFSDNMPDTTRIFALVDADAYGLDIVSVYKYGSASMRHENESLAAERVEWIGVSASEALSLGVSRDALLPITVHDQRKALSLLRSNRDIPIPWKRELMQLLHIRRKAEIEVLSSASSTCYLDDLHDQDDISKCSVLKSSNLLIQYVIKKVTNALEL